MSREAAHTSRWVIGEVVFGVPFLVALALHYLFPLSLPPWLPRWGLLMGGVTLSLAGVVIIVLSRRELARYGQPTDPGEPTTRVVTTGVYSFSRNPLYLGAVCVLAGVGLAFNLPWVLLLLLPSIVACHFVLIAPEERFLRAAFGDVYEAYAARVNRWVGRRGLGRDGDRALR